MWTSMLDLDPKRVLVTQLLRHIWPGACFSSFAPLQVRNLPRQPLPDQTWVRVRNRLAGICGSDLHLVQADGDFRIAPAAIVSRGHTYPGHEVVGEVLEIGEKVQHIRVGDRVALQYGPNCLAAGVQTPCHSCTQGHYNLCEYGEFPAPYPIGAGWSEEMLLPEQQLFRLSPNINDEQAALLEPTSVAIHAVLRRLPQQGERVLIIGAGTIGLLTLQIVRALAPQAEISVMARHAFQIEQATRMGATHIIYPEDSYSNIQRTTNARLYKGSFGNQMLLGGYDVIFDSVGSQKTLHHALRWARARATVVLVGVHLHMMHIDLTPIWYQEINLIGSTSSGLDIWPSGTHEQLSTFEIATQLIQQGQIHPERLITHRFPLNNYQAALLAATGKARSRAIKVVFDYSLLPPSVVPNVRASAPRTRRPSAQEMPSPSPQPAEPAIPAATASYTYGEEDRSEDTIKIPVLARRLAQTLISKPGRHADEPATDTTPEQSSAEPLEVTAATTVPTYQITEIPAEATYTAEEAFPSPSSSPIPVEEASEIPEFAATNTLQDRDEPFALPSMSLREAMELFDPSVVDAIQFIEDAPQSPSVSIPAPEEEVIERPVSTASEDAQIIDDSFLLPSISLREAIEAPEPARAETVQIIDESFQSPSLPVRKTVEPSEQPIDNGQHDPEHGETPLESTNPATELPGSSAIGTGDEPFLADSSDKEESEVLSATGDTEIALQSIEDPSTVRMQSHSRTRMRKKSGRGQRKNDESRP